MDVGLRRSLAMCLVVVGCVLAYLSYGPLHNLWSEYQDSPFWVYLTFGLPLLAGAAASWWFACTLLRR